MKRHFLTVIALLFITSPFLANAQDAPEIKKDERSNDYRRSSLCLILVDEADMPNRDTIVQAFLDAPMPEKYNDHNISCRVFCPDDWQICDADRESYDAAVKSAFESRGEGKQAPKKKGGFGKFMKAAAGVAIAATTGAESSVMFDSKDKEEYAIIANRHLLEDKVAKQLFDKWFMDNDNNFTMDLIRQRGLYDASTLNVQTAKNSVRGMGVLEDAGEELINNTFVVVSRFRYISKDELLAEIEAITNSASGDASGLGALATMALKATVVGSGYYVRSTSFLFQLKWNDDISNTFYANLWDNHGDYNDSDIFSLRYIGQESAFANVKAGIFTDKTEGELIRIATVNATDAVLAKLEKKYEIFRTKTPIVIDGDKITAFIGMKEGVEGGDKFEVLEQIVDSETGKTSYKRKTTVTVAKNKIWDNRFMANEELAQQGKEQTVTATEFVGSTNGLYGGMLLRQIK